MDIVNIRILLSALIAVVPTVMSLILVMLTAFPRGNAGFIKNTSIYNKSLTGIIFLVGISTISVMINTLNLFQLDVLFQSNDFLLLVVGLWLSIAVFVAVPIFLFWYLLKTANL